MKLFTALSSLLLVTSAHAEPVDRSAVIAAINQVPTVVTGSVLDAKQVTAADVKTYPSNTVAIISPPLDCQSSVAYSRSGSLIPVGRNQFSYKILTPQDTIAFSCNNGSVYLILAYRR